MQASNEHSWTTSLVPFVCPAADTITARQSESKPMKNPQTTTTASAQPENVRQLQGDITNLIRTMKMAKQQIVAGNILGANSTLENAIETVETKDSERDQRLLGVLVTPNR